MRVHPIPLVVSFRQNHPNVRVLSARFFHMNELKSSEVVMLLKDSQTLKNLVQGFTGEAIANRRYLYFARKADIEGHTEIASLFRDTAEGETGHAFGHFEFMAEVGDPATGLPVGETELNLRSAVQGETYEFTEMYPSFARIARSEGFPEIGEWFETLARAEKSHAGRFQKALDSLPRY